MPVCLLDLIMMTALASSKSYSQICVSLETHVVCSEQVQNKDDMDADSLPQ